MDEKGALRTTMRSNRKEGNKEEREVPTKS